jgi:hypothetical protein
MKVLRSLLVLALAVVGFCLVNTSSYAQSKGTDAQQKIKKSKVGQDMRDVKKNAPGTFDGSGKRPAPAVKAKTTTMPTVTPTQRNIAVPKQYRSLHTTPPPSPKVTPKKTTTKPSSSSSPSSTQKK